MIISTADLLQDLVTQKENLATNINDTGIEANIQETLNTLVPKVPQVYNKGREDGYNEGFEVGHINGLTDMVNMITNMENFSYLFYDKTYDFDTIIPYINTANGINFSYMFANSLVETIPLFDTSNGVNFARMFYNTELQTVPLFDVSNGTNFSYMFWGCGNLKTIPLLNTKNGINFSYMFSNCMKLSSIPNLDTSNGTDFSHMFEYLGANLSGAGAITLPTTMNTSNGVNFAHMFSRCYLAKYVPQMDTSNGTDFSYMYSNCQWITEVTGLDTSNGTKFSYMFEYCGRLETIETLNLSKCTSASLSLFNAWNSKIKNITFEGTIPCSLTFYSNVLTYESLIGMINALVDYSGTTTTRTLKIGTTNLNKLTDEEKAIATEKGWTLA